jgi:hypothetical protein
MAARVFEHATEIHFVEAALFHALQKVGAQFQFPRPPRWPRSCRQAPSVRVSVCLFGSG